MKETYSVPTFKLPELDKEFDKLNRKAAQLGCDPVGYEIVGTPYQDRVSQTMVEAISALDNEVHHASWLTEFVKIKVFGNSPKLSDWEFMGYVDTDGIAYGDVTLAERERRGGCDYCGKTRQRRHTFVVLHKDGGRKMVGSSCLKDFIGHKSPQRLAAFLRQLATLFVNFDYFDRDWISDPTKRTYPLDQVLETSRRIIKMCGWTSGSESFESGVVSTKDRVFDWMVSPDAKGRIGTRQYSYTSQWKIVQEDNGYPDSDPDLVALAIEWAKGNVGSDDMYLNNIGAIATSGYCTYRAMGFAVSILVAYERHLAKIKRDEEREVMAKNSQHIGEVGKRQVFDDVELTFIKYVESYYGVTVMHKFNMNGSQLVWFGSKELNKDTGDVFSIKATVKDHGEFNGIPQTTINRVVVEETE